MYYTIFQSQLNHTRSGMNITMQIMSWPLVVGEIIKILIDVYN